MFKSLFVKYCCNAFLLCPLVLFSSQLYEIILLFTCSILTLPFSSVWSRLHFWAASLPHNCLLSLTPFWFWCSLFAFVNSTTFFFCVMRHTRDILPHAPCYLFCPQPLLLACLVLFWRWFHHSPFVSSPRPFYSRCLLPLVFSFFDCLNSWPPPPPQSLYHWTCRHCIFDFSNADQCEVPDYLSPPLLISHLSPHSNKQV